MLTVASIPVQLPHRTGTTVQDLFQDEIVLITRATLLKISVPSIGVVFDALVSLLEDLSRPYRPGTAAAHPPHVLNSEFYIINLIADCCSSHWNGGPVDLEDGELAIGLRPPKSRQPPNQSLDTRLVNRVFDILKIYTRPLPDGFSLSTQTLLDRHHTVQDFGKDTLEPPNTDTPLESQALYDSQVEVIERYTRTICEFVVASSWPGAFEYLRKVIYVIRTTTSAQNSTVQTSAAIEDERTALVLLRMIGCFWVDAHKLGLLIQEVCSSYLHFRRHFQDVIAVVTPLLVTRWLDRHPEEFVKLHTSHKRLDGGPDTLFDMTQTVVHDNGRSESVADGVRRRLLQYPLQTTLLFLLPDVFEVASNLREAKSGSMSKKVAFLDGLRKALRNRNEQAAYCLVMLLRAARHFDLESDSAFMSYALDVQDEVRDAVFRRSTSGPDSCLFEQEIMTAAFVSLTDLNYDGCIESLAPSCLAPAAPLGFKVALIQASTHFASLEDPDRYKELYRIAVDFVLAQLHVRRLGDFSCCEFC